MQTAAEQDDSFEEDSPNKNSPYQTTILHAKGGIWTFFPLEIQSNVFVIKLPGVNIPCRWKYDMWYRIGSRWQGFGRGEAAGMAAVRSQRLPLWQMQLDSTLQQTDVP